jgi:hypothetical protein
MSKRLGMTGLIRDTSRVADLRGQVSATPTGDGSVIIATRFSQLRTTDTAAPGEPSRADLIYEALSALAESLDCLAKMLHALPGEPALDARLGMLRRRTALLEAQIRASA